MTVTISVNAKTIFFRGDCHHLSRAGCNRVLGWLFSNALLIRGWMYDRDGEYVFLVEVQS